jgi:hypothetical protein
MGLGKTPFFPAEDCPAIIEIFGNRQERIHLIKMYVNEQGECIGGDVNDTNNVFNPQSILAMEGLIKDQKALDAKEKAYAEEMKIIKKTLRKGNGIMPYSDQRKKK